MGNVNRVIIVGNLGGDPELRRTPSGQAYCHLNVATHEVFRDPSGQRQQRTEWHRVTCWSQTAESCVRFLRKGQPVFVEGRLTFSEWEDRDGSKRRSAGEVATRVVFLSGQRSQEPRQEAGDALQAA